jgi:hypothetical protein
MLSGKIKKKSTKGDIRGVVYGGIFTETDRVTTNAMDFYWKIIWKETTYATSVVVGGAATNDPLSAIGEVLSNVK